MDLSQELHTEVGHLELTGPETDDTSVDGAGGHGLAEVRDDLFEGVFGVEAHMAVAAPAKEVDDVAFGLKVHGPNAVPFLDGGEGAEVSFLAATRFVLGDFHLAGEFPP